MNIPTLDYFQQFLQISTYKIRSRIWLYLPKEDRMLSKTVGWRAIPHMAVARRTCAADSVNIFLIIQCRERHGVPRYGRTANGEQRTAVGRQPHL
jgi:hypothetical protein